MPKNKIPLKQIGQWCVALVVALVIMDLLTFAFYRPCQELIREHGATTGFLLPRSHGVYGMEGYCIAGIDASGYVDRDLPRADSYFVAAGASHTEGLFLPAKLRYSDRLSSMLGGDDELHIYNIGRSGNFFSVVLQHLDGILAEFPDAEGIIIETDALTYDTKALYDSQSQVGYDPDETAEALLSNLSGRQRLSMKVKQCLPILPELHKQYLTYKNMTAKSDSSDILDPDFWAQEYAGGYSEALSSLMAFIRDRTDKQVIILYHPAVRIEPDGSLKLLSNGAEPYYREICAEYDIDFVDMSEAYLKAYKEDHIVPYGFANTTMGAGHTNREAHRMMAEELYKVIKQKNVDNTP